MMKRLIWILFLCAPLCAGPNTISPLQEQNNRLTIALTRSYGPGNPFLELTSTVDLVEELRTTHTTRAHHTELTQYADALMPAVASCIEAFETDSMKAPALKQLTHAANSAGLYICTNLSKEAAQTQATKRHQRRHKRMIGSLVGASMIGGSVKYVMLGMLCATVFGLMWSVYHSWTRPVHEKTNDILRKRNKLKVATQEFAQAAQQYHEATTHQTEATKITVDRGFFAACKRFFRNTKERAQNMTRSPEDQQVLSKSLLKSVQQLDTVLATMENHPDLFRIDQQDYPTIAQARISLHAWQVGQRIH